MSTSSSPSGKSPPSRNHSPNQRKKDKQHRTLAETIVFLGKRPHTVPALGKAKLQKLDTNNQFSALSDFMEEVEALILNHQSSLQVTVASQLQMGSTKKRKAASTKKKPSQSKATKAIASPSTSSTDTSAKGGKADADEEGPGKRDDDTQDPSATGTTSTAPTASEEFQECALPPADLEEQTHLSDQTSENTKALTPSIPMNDAAGREIPRNPYRNLGRGGGLLHTSLGNKNRRPGERMVAFDESNMARSSNHCCIRGLNLETHHEATDRTRQTT
jgi:hypothetical protein